MLSKTLDDTNKIAEDFIKNLTQPKNGALVVALSGNLGAGKTTFTKAAARFLKAKGVVNSPTFVILKKYPIKFLGYKFLYHIDAYRLKDAGEILHLGFEEILGDNKNIVIIEWPENISNALPKNTKRIKIKHDLKGGRKFEIK